MTLSGIDPATFRFVAQCLSHCATACRLSKRVQRFIEENSFFFGDLAERNAATVLGFVGAEGELTKFEKNILLRSRQFGSIQVYLHNALIGSTYFIFVANLK
jgi:hypothetical protein